MIDMSVKDMTDQQLNRELAELMGFTVGKSHHNNFHYLIGNGVVISSPKWTESAAWEEIPNYCNDPAASLEVQAKALEIDTDTYIRHLGALICDRAADHYNNKSIAKLLNAPPRQRAEAAYMTLSKQD
ncbi:hypothetical protein D1872_185780 [compost metagenome]